MEKSDLFHLIHSFQPVERREVLKFLQSPFFNKRQDVIALFELISGAASLSKEQCWAVLFGNAPYEDHKIRLVMSYLHKLLEHYLSIKEVCSDKGQLQMLLITAYRKKRMTAAAQKNRRILEKGLEEHTLRNQTYYETRYRSQWEAHQLNSATNPTDISQLSDISFSVDVIYLIQKLRILCLHAAHQSVYNAPVVIDNADGVLELSVQPRFYAVPAVAVFRSCYLMLTSPEEEAHFQVLKKLLLDQSDLFPVEEMHVLYILTINYCVRRLNAGEEHFVTEVLDLYKTALDKAYLLEDGVLSRFTYHNIAAAGITTGDLDWVRYFIDEYKSKLEKTWQESSFSYNLAKLEYASRRYSEVLQLLQKANYRDPLLNLAAKTLLLKTCYELDELDLLQSHLDAMRNYIHRKSVLGYHRTNYLNIIRYTEKLLRLRLHDKSAVIQFREAVQKEEILSERAFFLGVGK